MAAGEAVLMAALPIGDGPLGVPMRKPAVPDGDGVLAGVADVAILGTPAGAAPRRPLFIGPGALI